MITLTPMNLVADRVRNLIWSPALKRFPDLQFALSEGGIGWLPYFLERIDYVYERHRFWTHQDFGDELPSQRARKNFTFCFIDDKAGVAQPRADRHRQHHLGVRLPALGLDLAARRPRRWPSTSTRASRDADINKMTYLNAMRVFQLRPVRAPPEGEVHRRSVAGGGRGGDDLGNPLTQVSVAAVLR